MIIYSLDFETNTEQGDGLNPMNPLTSITSAAVRFGPLDPEGSGPEGAISFDDSCEQRLLLGVRNFFESPWTEPGCIVTWNGAAFDIPFFISRTQRHNIPLFKFEARVSDQRKPKYKALNGHEGGYILRWGGHTHADIWPAFMEFQKAAGISGKLKDTAEHLGFEPIRVDASKMQYLTVPERMAYNVSDVEVTYEIARMMEYLHETGDIPAALPHYFDRPLFEEAA